MNIVDLFEDNHRKNGNYETLVWENETWTSDEVASEWHRLSGLLVKLGIRAGDRVAILLPNIPEVHLVFPAVWKLGAVAAPIHYTYSAYEVEEILRTISPSAIVTTSKKAKELVKYLPVNFDRRKIIVTDWDSYSEFRDFYEVVPEKTPETHQCTESDPAVIIFSSGSSGKPKGVLQSHSNILSLIASCKATEHSKDSVMQPFFTEEQTVTIDFSSYAHTGRLFFFVMGNCRKQKTILRDGFDALSVLKDIQEFKVTFFGGSPVAYEEICRHTSFRDYDLQSVKAWAYFAAPMSEDKSIHYERILGKRIYAVYGLSESITLVACEPATTKRRQSVGLPLSGTKIKIIGSDGAEVRAGELGELCVSRKANALGYLDMPGETKKVFRKDWVHTGDLARIDSDGYVYIVGRNSAMINQGGFKVVPGEVEAVLDRMEAVDGCVVAGVPDDLFGEVVGAFIRVRAGMDLTEQAVIAHCRGFLSDNKIPRKTYFVDAFPKTKAGKLDARRLVKEAQEGEKLSLEASGSGFLNLSEAEAGAKVAEVARVVLSDLLGIPLAGIDPQGRLTEMGMTSLKAVEFSSRLGRRIGQLLCSALVFNYPTVEKIAGHIATDVLGPKDGSAKTSGMTTEELAREVVLAPEIAWNRHITQAQRETGALLVTGATGFFGSHLLDVLSVSSYSELICLVRAKNEEEGKQKLRMQMRAFGLDEEPLMSRVSVIPGDVALDKLGLSDSMYSVLSERVGVIYHVAALVNHLFAYSEFYLPNVQGTREILRFASVGREKTLQYVSTIAVKVTKESGSLDHDRPLRTGYAQSKWVAEKMVAVAKNRGLEVSVFRAGQLCWSSDTGVANTTQLECLLLNAMIVLKQHPPADVLAQILPNIAPVDYAARAMVYLSRPEMRNGVYHLISPKPTDWGKMVRAMIENGCSLTEVPYETWLSELELRSGEFKDGSGTKLLALLRNSNRAMGGFDYSCEETAAALYGSGVAFPEPWTSMKVYLKYLEKKGGANGSGN